MRLPLPIRSYRDVPADATRLVNMQAEALPPDAKTPVTIVRVPGVRPFTAAGGGPGRGIAVHRGSLYAVSGAYAYRIAGVATQIPGVIPGTERVSFASNGIELVATTGGRGYAITDEAREITDPDFTSRSAGVCGFVDQYIAFVERNSGRWFISDLAAGTVYDPLNFATAEGSPDDLVSLLVDHRQVILFGKDSVEAWWNSGVSGFPFERIAGTFVELGCIGQYSPVKADNAPYWLASDRTFRRMSGSTPVRVSTHGVEKALQRYDYLEDAEGFSYTLNGHICVGWNFPTEGTTWVLDVTTGEWHERESYPASCWNALGAISLNGTTYVQHRTTGAIGVLDDQTYTDFGDILRAEWTLGNVAQQGRRLFHHSLRLIMETGVGTATGGTPSVLLQYSDDGGATWYTHQPRSIGAIGQRVLVVEWHALGSSRDRVYKCLVSAAVPVRVFGAELEADLGNS